MVRRSVAAGAGLLVLILLVVGVRGCLDSRKEAAINDYVRDVDALMNESDRFGEALFSQLAGGGGATDVEIQNALNTFAIESTRLVERADLIDTPDELAGAQRYVIDTLELRSEGIGLVADNLPNAIATGDRQEGAAEEIARAMQVFLTSDILYFRRVRPQIDAVLREEELEQQLGASTYIEDITWVDPAEIASRIEGVGGTASDEEAAAGVHGNGLGTVTLGGQTLTPDGSTGVTVSEDLTIAVQVANQGEHTETDVPVTVTIGSGGDAIEREKVLATIAAGETKTVEIPIDRQPPTGQTVPVGVEIGLVSGEDESIGNNAADFSVIFTS
ncbi:MAG: hypothetical protein WD993_06040 [Thermoleophilaceae bacterium]